MMTEKVRKSMVGNGQRIGTTPPPTPNEIERKAVRWAGTSNEEKESQLDRIEKKLDILLEKLDEKFVTKSTLTQTVSALQSQIQVKVDKDDVIASINLSDEGIRIEGNKLHIDAHTLVDQSVGNNHEVRITSGTIDSKEFKTKGWGK